MPSLLSPPRTQPICRNYPITKEALQLLILRVSGTSTVQHKSENNRKGKRLKILIFLVPWMSRLAWVIYLSGGEIAGYLFEITLASTIHVLTCLGYLIFWLMSVFHKQRQVNNEKIHRHGWSCFGAAKLPTSVRSLWAHMAMQQNCRDLCSLSQQFPFWFIALSSLSLCGAQLAAGQWVKPVQENTWSSNEPERREQESRGRSYSERAGLMTELGTFGRHSSNS